VSPSKHEKSFFRTLLEAWNGSGSYTYDRIGRGTIHIKATCISILGGIQPGPLAKYLRAATTGEKGDDGLIQRFQLLVYPDDPGKWQNVDRWPDKEAKNRVFELFKNLDAHLPSDGFAGSLPLCIGAETQGEGEIPFLRFTPEAQDFFDGWRKDLETKIRSGEEHPVIESHLSKYRSLRGIHFTQLTTVGGFDFTCRLPSAFGIYYKIRKLDVVNFCIVSLTAMLSNPHILYQVDSSGYPSEA